ncbi:hypothetical protein PCANC_11812 [Puccinia coronata f. sp. avenae]|uniref:Uncharacterized protein n=1 Tax=Puccinia coronata f. sp. avenae TaxID=200324 RepID=A0A2N5T0F9_9BASI|nr:hypothetical protein PCANC_11812 [Puccinia coronata f. sp. avenae]
MPSIGHRSWSLEWFDDGEWIHPSSFPSAAFIANATSTSTCSDGYGSNTFHGGAAAYDSAGSCRRANSQLHRQSCPPPSSSQSSQSIHILPASRRFTVLFVVIMLAFKVISALSIAGAFLTAHPLKTNDLLAPRYTGSITTTTTATASYQSLTTRIQTIRQNIATGQYSYTEVQTQVESFSYEVSTTLTAINDCANCFRPESVSSLKQTAQQTYAELDLLIDTCHRAYPQQAPSLFAMGSWSQLDTHLHRNLERFSESGVHATSILPPTFVKNTARVNWGRTSNFVNHQFGGSRGF